MTTSTNYTDLAYILESVEGETPATPQFQLLPTTGGSPVGNITTAVSEVIRSDRQTDDLTIVDSDVSGDVNYELSYGPYIPFMKSLMENDAPTTAVSLTTLTGVSGGTTISGGTVDTSVATGDVFRLAAADATDIDGVYTCTDNTTGGQISIYPPLPATGGDSSLITLDITSTISNGADTPDSYTIRKRAFNDSADYYWYYTGCKINTMSFEFATGSILNGSFGVIGLVETPQDDALAGEQADLDVAEYSIMNSVTSIGAIYLGGVTFGKCSFSNLSLTIDNQINAAKGLGTLGACASAAFSLQVTASTEVYFENLDLYTKFKAATAFAVTLMLEDGLGNMIGISMPKCKFETLDTPIDGKDSFLMQSGTIRALRESTENYMVKFSFVDAA